MLGAVVQFAGNNNNGLIDNRQQHQPDLQLPVRPKRRQRRQLKSRAEKIKVTAMGHPVEKIRRPPNAFMFFSNEWRKKIAAIYPEESNSQISVRLGGMWKGIEGVHKNVYFALARQAEAEHKKKYPDYVYIPMEARTQKLLREQARDMKFGRTRRLTTAQTSSARPLPAEEHQKGGTTGTLGVASSEGQNKISQNSAPSNTQSATAGITDSLSFRCEVAGGEEDTKVPLPVFEEDCCFTEFGPYCNEGNVVTIRETDFQQFANNERCPKLTDASLTAIGQRCSNLKFLDISYCTGISQEGSEHLKLCLQSLHRLDRWNLH